MIAGLLASPVMTQSTAQERAANLRQQLAEVQAKQTELETRLQQLEEDLKPENIEKGLAGIGSTRPEELREQRRRQLEIEKKERTNTARPTRNQPHTFGNRDRASRLRCLPQQCRSQRRCDR